MIRSAKELGKLIQTTRKKSRLTQAEVAAACNVGLRFIRELEHGKPTCQLEKSLYVARMLGIRLEPVLPKELFPRGVSKK